MNEYKKKVLKRNITAFLLSCGILTLLALVVLLLAFLGSMFREYLPHITTAILLFGFAFGLSIPIRYHLIDKENAREYQRQKDEERKRNGWKPY